jgi:hypothetical protein
MLSIYVIFISQIAGEAFGKSEKSNLREGKMAEDRVFEIAQLLDQAGRAHGKYEQSELKGVYDQGWPRWYAGYVVEQGISALLGHVVTVDQVAAFFVSSYADFQKANSGESWSNYTARRLQAEL